MPSPDSHRLTARTPGVSISQPSPGSAQQLGGDGGVAAAVVAARAPSVVACTSLAEQGVDERRLADAAGAEERQRAAAARRTPAARSSPAPVRPLVTSTGTPRATSTSSRARRLRVVDEVGLGQHDDRLGAAVERQHELALEPALVRRRAEGVGEEDDVDVGGERVGLGAGALERRPPHERRPARRATCSTRSPSADGTTQSPTATSAPMLRTRDALERRVAECSNGAPAPVEPRHPPRRRPGDAESRCQAASSSASQPSAASSRSPRGDSTATRAVTDVADGG